MFFLNHVLHQWCNSSAQISLQIVDRFIFVFLSFCKWINLRSKSKYSNVSFCWWMKLIDKWAHSVSYYSLTCVAVLMKWCDEWTRHADIESAQDKIVAQEVVIIKVQLVKMNEQRSSCGCVNCCYSGGPKQLNPVDFELLIPHHQRLSTNRTNSAPCSFSSHQTADSTRKLRSSLKLLTSWQMQEDAATTL